MTTQLALSLSLANKSVGILDVDLTGPSIPRLLGLEDAKITQAQGGWTPVTVHSAQTLPPLPSALNPPHPSDLKANGSVTSSADATNTATNPPSSSTSTSTSTSTTDSIPVNALYATSLAFLLPSRSSAVIWRGPKKTAMVRQFLTDVLWPELDYLLIDTPPGTSDEHISLAENLLKLTDPALGPGDGDGNDALMGSEKKRKQLAGAIVVTTPQAVATADVRKEINFCRKTGIPVLGVVENMSGFVCECCGERTNLFGKGGGEVMSSDFGVKFLGGVPVDLGWGSVVEEGGWAAYGGGGKKEGEYEEEEGSDDDEDEEVETRPAEQISDDDGRSRRKGDGEQLVQRYRSCKLSEVFRGITEQVIDLVEGGHDETSD